MTIRQKRPRRKAENDAPRPYQSLWEGVKGEPALPREVRDALAILDDVRSAELWLRQQAVTLEASEKEDGITFNRPGRRHLTTVGWIPGEDRVTRTVVFDGKLVTEDDVDELTEYAISRTVHSINVMTDRRSARRRNTTSRLGKTTETILIELADEQALTPSAENVKRKPCGYRVEAGILHGRAHRAMMAAGADESGFTNQEIAVNHRTQLCLDWLCRTALAGIREDPISRSARQQQQRLTARPWKNGRTGPENSPADSTKRKTTQNPTKPGDPPAAPADDRSSGRRAATTPDPIGSRYRYH